MLTAYLWRSTGGGWYYQPAAQEAPFDERGHGYPTISAAGRAAAAAGYTHTIRGDQSRPRLIPPKWRKQ